MTIANEDARTGPYNGNGATTAFDYDFKVVDQAHLVVTLTDASSVDTVQTITTHYTVSGVGDEGGGSITMVTAPATGELLTITRDVTRTQEVDLQNRGSFLPNTIERAFDKLTQITQDLSELLNRAVKQPVTSTVELTFPAPTGNADKVIGFNSAGTDLEAKTVNTAAYITTPTSVLDNQIVRFNGTSGEDFQASTITADDNNDLDGVRNVQMTGSIEDTNGNEVASFSTAASAVNEVTIKNAATGAGPEVQATGDDTNADLILRPKGTGRVKEGSSNILNTSDGGILTTKVQMGITTQSSSAGAVTFDFSSILVQRISLTENVTSITISDLSQTDAVEIFFRQGASDYTVTGWTGYTIYWLGGTEPTIVSGSNNQTVVTLRYDPFTTTVLGSYQDFSV